MFSTRLSELPIFLIKGFLSQTSQWNPVHPSYHYNYKEPGILGLWSVQKNHRWIDVCWLIEWTESQTWPPGLSEVHVDPHLTQRQPERGEPIFLPH